MICRFEHRGILQLKAGTAHTNIVRHIRNWLDELTDKNARHDIQDLNVKVPIIPPKHFNIGQIVVGGFLRDALYFERINRYSPDYDSYPQRLIWVDKIAQFWGRELKKALPYKPSDNPLLADCYRLSLGNETALKLFTLKVSSIQFVEKILADTLTDLVNENTSQRYCPGYLYSAHLQGKKLHFHIMVFPFKQLKDKEVFEKISHPQRPLGLRKRLNKIVDKKAEILKANYTVVSDLTTENLNQRIIFLLRSIQARTDLTSTKDPCTIYFSELEKQLFYQAKKDGNNLTYSSFRVDFRQYLGIEFEQSYRNISLYDLFQKCSEETKIIILKRCVFFEIAYFYKQIVLLENQKYQGIPLDVCPPNLYQKLSMCHDLISQALAEKHSHLPKKFLLQNIAHAKFSVEESGLPSTELFETDLLDYLNKTYLLGKKISFGFRSIFTP